jgi:AcrR family transcriptional regulator
MSSMIAKRSLEPDTRQRIIDVAAKLFAEHGFDGTSVRDIATELGIANPSIYYHFKSKADLMTELLTEPLRCVEDAVLEAKELTGEARSRRIIKGLLESLEVNHGIVLTALRDNKKGVKSPRDVAFEMRHYIGMLLAETIAQDHHELRVMMAIGAVEGVVTGMIATATDIKDFIEQLRGQRPIITDLVLKILGSP